MVNVLPDPDYQVANTFHEDETVLRDEILNILLAGRDTVRPILCLLA